jgi:hypothetical protein
LVRPVPQNGEVDACATMPTDSIDLTNKTHQVC